MPSTIGTQLKNARLDHNLSLEDVFESTHIRIKYLKALEADDFTAMPSPVQGRGFLRLYAQHLGLNIENLLEEIRNTDEEITPKFTKIEEKSNLDEPNAEPTPSMDEDEPLWERFQHRLAEALARPEPDTVDETESPSIAEASPKQTRPEEIHPIEKDATSPPPKESRIIFEEIAKTLEERREMLSLTYTEVEGHIHLRPRYLEALEKGDFGALPSPVQTRGMLNNYAEFLDLDADALLIRYAEGLQAQRVARQIKEREHLASTPKKKRKFALGGFIAPDLIFGVGMVALLIAFTIWGLGRIAKSNIDEKTEATAPSIAEVLMTTPTISITGTATPTVIVNTPAPDANTGTEVPIEEVLPEGNFTGVQILVTIMQRAWIRVSVDGTIAFEGRANSNATFVYEGNEVIEIITGNGAGVRIAYNNKDLGLMGGFGEVVQRLYGARAILTPTVTPTLPVTPTFTPTITLTPTPTKTPIPTGTP